MKCFKIMLDGDSTPLFLGPEELQDYLEAEVQFGSTYSLEAVEMSREELDALPEFDGF